MYSGNQTKEEAFVADLIKALLAHAERAQQDVIRNQGTKAEAFDLGVVQGYWQVLSSLISRMQIYDLDLVTYGLADFDPDSIWSRIRENLASVRHADDETAASTPDKRQ